MLKSILVTGGLGFIGHGLCNYLKAQGYKVFGTVRNQAQKQLFLDCNVRPVCISDIASETNWKKILIGIDVVIHTAARVHMMQESSTDPLEVYRETNTYATARLVEQAIAADVKHFIFLSSIKINGATTDVQSFSELDRPNPVDAYGHSKLEAEELITKKCAGTAMSYTIFRLPLVYGYGVKANFAALVKLVQKKWPLPLARIKNKRSILYLGNLISAIQKSIDSKNSHNQLFCISDDNDISTTQLIKYIADAYGVKARLFYIPLVLFKFIARLTGKSNIILRLFGSLQIDSKKLQKTLDWKPPYTVESALAEMAQQEKLEHAEK